MTNKYIYLPLLMLLAACGSDLNQQYTRAYPKANKASDYVWQAPLCVFICTTSLTAAASSAIGSNTQTQSQQTTQSTGALQ